MNCDFWDFINWFW